MSAYSRALLACALALAPLAAAFHLAFAAVLVLHALASAAAALLVRSLVPDERLQHPRAALGFLFAFAFFIPFAGVVAAVCAAKVVQRSEARRRRAEFEQHASPAFEPGGEAPARRSEGGIRQRLADRAAPTESRLRALLAMQAMPARSANPVIREMLSDSTEDLRLVAYGILDTREKTINARIHEASKRNAHKELAELYSELIYQGLAQGDLRAHAAAQAQAHIEQALARAPQDGALHALAGQIALSRGDLVGAQTALERARLLGLPESRVLPYIAETAFLARRFEEVRASIRTLAAQPNVQAIERVVAYWSASP